MTRPPRPLDGLAELRDAAHDAARREWRRLAHLPSEVLPREARLTLVTDTVWNLGYAVGYRNAGARVATQVRAIARGAAENGAPHSAEPDQVRRVLNRLSTATGRQPRAPLVPPTPADTLAAVLGEPPGRDPARRATETTWPAAVHAGGVAGIVTTATDILIEWRRLVGATDLGRARIGIHPVIDWAEGMLRGVNQQAVAASAWTTTSDAEFWARLRTGDGKAAGQAGPAPQASTAARAAQGFPLLRAVTGAATSTTSPAVIAAVLNHGAAHGPGRRR